jgi:phosphatidylserine/phosphatidylglycerophosphate/cardiolipin synthase-like enzyme
VVLDRAIKPGGESNHKLFHALWPRDVPLPLLYTWNPEVSDKYLKLHAKIIVADHNDALVTSANLTMHALDLNMEMGVRVKSSPASSIAEHFVLLIDHGVLKEYILEV